MTASGKDPHSARLVSLFTKRCIGLSSYREEKKKEKKRMKHRKVLAVIAAAAAMMSIGFSASAEEKVLNFGCAM